ncbi:hypothetical protein BDY24DRAFT_386840 [Mrakia frigida]|uniref:zinc finger MYND domain-containing protein n=1 Tax=Mrakia frigida TaxID=29902 RepID=UPI003FCC1588
MSSPAEQSIKNSSIQTPGETASQCQACFKHIPTSKVLVCGRCKSSRYCSVECQKKAYPSHKDDCRAKAAILAKPVGSGQPTPDDHKAFMDIHRPIVTYAAVSAFELHTEEGRASLSKKVMVIHSKFNPLEKEDGKKFSFLGGSVETMEEVAAVFPPQLKLIETRNRLAAEALNLHGTDLYSLVLWVPAEAGSSFLFVTPLVWVNDDIKNLTRTREAPEWKGLLQEHFEKGKPVF